MKALILAAGRGVRLGRAKGPRSKSMVLVGGRPLIQHSLDIAVQSGVIELIVAVNDLFGEVAAHYGNAYRGVSMTYVEQAEPRGIVDAIASSEVQIGGHDFMLFLADEVFGDGLHHAMLRSFHDQPSTAICGVVENASVEDVRKNYVVLGCSCDQRVYRMIEKPARPPGRLRGTGSCIFRASIFEHVSGAMAAEGMQADLASMMQRAVDAGELVRYFPLATAYVNVNTPAELQAARAMVDTSEAVSASPEP